MTLAKVKARADKTFIVQASLMIIPYDRQNIFIAQATEGPQKKLPKNSMINYAINYFLSILILFSFASMARTSHKIRCNKSGIKIAC
jgi:hypothetical protein